MSPEEERRGRTFIVATFVVAAVVGVAIAYLGLAGYLGGPIP